MAISAQTNVPQLPPLKIVTVAQHYTYLWPAVKKKLRGRIVETKGKASVGKILGGGPVGLVVWKEEFLNQYPELRAYNVYREEVERGEHSKVTEYRFVFRPKASQAEDNSMQTQQYYQAGATWLCDRLLRSSPFLVALNRTFVQEGRNLKLLSLCYYTLLHQTIDFSEYLHFCADTRLAWQGSMTEYDINALLQEISDVDLSHFFAQLQSLCARRATRRDRFYALELNYPHDLTRKMQKSTVNLSTNNPQLDKELRRLLKDPALNTAAMQSFLQRWADLQDEHALVVFNALNGIPHLFHTYHDEDFSLPELCSFLRAQALPDDKARSLVLSLELNAMGQKSKSREGRSYGSTATSSNEFLRIVDEDNDSDSAVTAILQEQTQPSAQELVQRNLYSLGSVSGLGGIEGLKDESKEELNLGSNTISGASRLRSQRAKDEGVTPSSIELNDSGSVHAQLRTLSASEALGSKVSTRTSNSFMAARAHGLEDPQAQKQVLWVTSRKERMLATLRYFLQQQLGFLWVVPEAHSIFQHLMQRHSEQLIAIDHYDSELQYFSLSFKLNQHYPEYDVSASSDSHAGVGANSAGLFAGKSRFLPRKMLSPLYVHLLLDLKPLFALKDRIESQSEDYDAEDLEADAFDSDDEDLDLLDTGDAKHYFWQSDKVLRASTQGELTLSDEQCSILDSIQELLERHLKRAQDTPLSHYMATHAPTPEDDDLETAAGSSYSAPQAGEETDADDFFDVPDDDDAVSSTAQNEIDTDDDADDFFAVGDDDDFEASTSKTEDSDDTAPLRPSSHYLRTGEVDPKLLAKAGVDLGYDSSILDFEDDEDEDDTPLGLSSQESARLQRYLKQILHSKVAIQCGAVKVLVSNRVDSAQEARSAAHYLQLGNQAFDLMSLDVFKSELARLNPLTVDAKPALQQLLRGKNFVLFLALSMHFMLQAALDEKDRQYGSQILRQRLNIRNVPQYLEALQRIVAERRDTGFVYPSINQDQRALLEYLNVTTPSHETFTDSSSDTEVRLARL